MCLLFCFQIIAHCSNMLHLKLLYIVKTIVKTIFQLYFIMLIIYLKYNFIVYSERLLVFGSISGLLSSYNTQYKFNWSKIKSFIDSHLNYCIYPVDYKHHQIQLEKYWITNFSRFMVHTSGVCPSASSSMGLSTPYHC